MSENREKVEAGCEAGETIGMWTIMAGIGVIGTALALAPEIYQWGQIGLGLVVAGSGLYGVSESVLGKMHAGR